MAVCFSQASRRRSNRPFSPELTDARFESQARLIRNGKDSFAFRQTSRSSKAARRARTQNVLPLEEKLI